MSFLEHPECRGVPLPAALRTKLGQAYGEPDRAYHNVQHLEDVLVRYDEAARDVGWQHPVEVLLALLFHDVVYVPGDEKNERRSADVALFHLRQQGWEAVDTVYVQRLILLTAWHGKLTSAEVSPEEALFLDCDMAILGAAREAFDAYDRGIRAEYEALPHELFEAGRRAFAGRLLGSERIFLSEYFRGRLEVSARANLQRLLATPGTGTVRS